MTESELTKKRMIDLSKASFDRGIYTFSDFLTLAEQSDLLDAARAGVLYSGDAAQPYSVFGGYDGAERVMVRFGSENFCGYDQRRLLVNFALTGSEGELDLLSADAPDLRGRFAASVWFLLREGTVARIEGLENIAQDARVIACVQRLFTGDEVLPAWIGNEQQVMLRLFLACDTKADLAVAIKDYQDKIKAFDASGSSMLLSGFDAAAALEV